LTAGTLTLGAGLGVLVVPDPGVAVEMAPVFVVVGVFVPVVVEVGVEELAPALAEEAFAATEVEAAVVLDVLSSSTKNLFSLFSEPNVV